MLLMLRPAELVSLLIDTAGAISKVDFNNASNRQAYMKLERTITENLPMQVKKFMVRNIDKTPFDNEQVKIQGDMYSIQELVGSLQNGGPVKQNSMGILQMQTGGVTEEELAQQEPIPGEVVVPPEQQQPREANGATPDTVPMELREGDYVLNSLVKVTEGVGDLKKTIETALNDAKQDGVDLGNREGEIVDVIVGDDEVIIPKELVQYVGLDKLEKMNNRGKELMRAVQAASKEKQQGQA
jgi:hypothetical protein